MGCGACWLVWPSPAGSTPDGWATSIPCAAQREHTAMECFQRGINDLQLSIPLLEHLFRANCPQTNSVLQYLFGYASPGKF